MNIFLAPLFSLFSLRFYRQAVLSSLSKGLAYLAYLSFLAALAFALLFHVYGKPEFREMNQWLQGNLPPLAYSPEGLTMNAGSPRTIVNPKYGLTITFDMTKDNISAEEAGNAMIFVTKKNLYVVAPKGQMRVYPLARPGRQGNLVSVNETLKKVGEVFDRWIAFLIFAASFPLFFIWKLLAAIFYSLPGLLINRMRREKLAYSAVLNVSFFALTPVFLIQLLDIAFPSLPLSLGLAGALFLTTIYLFLGIKLTEEKIAPS